MKRLLLIALLLFGCGQDPSVSYSSIVWEGYPSKDENYSFLEKFSEVMSCLNNLNVYHDEEPYTLVVTDLICGSYVSRDGCYSNGKIYVASYAARSYPDSIGWAFDPFKHEVIHWATGLHSDSHESIYFTECQHNLHVN